MCGILKLISLEAYNICCHLQVMGNKTVSVFSMCFTDNDKR